MKDEFGIIPDDLIRTRRISDWSDMGCWVLATLCDCPPGPDNAAIFQQHVHHYLETKAFTVEREVPCLKNSGRRGRIDLVAKWGSGRVAIELDWLQPRYRSLAKLRLFDGYRIVILRRQGQYPYPISGVDAVVCIPAVKPLPYFLAGQAALNP